ncbi:hypothetical protein [Paracoccus mutanolyticus]|uniref:hypothetical protein n=1 Tax=Paracoccus mutanolyticus TaxID=1499308 RepID=UPI0016777C55
MTEHLRFIEAKGRIDSADSVMTTRHEQITSLNTHDTQRRVEDRADRRRYTGQPRHV